MRLRIVDVLGAQLDKGERAVGQQVNVFAETDFVQQRGLEGVRGQGVQVRDGGDARQLVNFRLLDEFGHALWAFVRHADVADLAFLDQVG